MSVSIRCGRPSTSRWPSRTAGSRREGWGPWGSDFRPPWAHKPRFRTAWCSASRATAVVNKLPVKVFIVNNQYHGMVRQWQDLFYEGRYASSYLDVVPDFVKL